MCCCGLACLTIEQLFRKHEERLWILLEEVNIKDSLRRWELKSLQVQGLIESCPRTPEIRNSSGHTDSCACHHYHLLVAALLEFATQVGQIWLPSEDRALLFLCECAGRCHITGGRQTNGQSFSKPLLQILESSTQVCR